MIVIDLMATTKSDKKFPSPGLTPKCWQKKALTLVCDEIQQRSVLDNKAALSPRRSYSSKPCRTGDYIALKPRDHAEKKRSVLDNTVALSPGHWAILQHSVLDNPAALSPRRSCWPRGWSGQKHPLSGSRSCSGNSTRLHRYKKQDDLVRNCGRPFPCLNYFLFICIRSHVRKRTTSVRIRLKRTGSGSGSWI